MSSIIPMQLNLKTAGLQIKQSRLRAGISQAELASLAGVSRATINGLENGSINEIGVNRLNRIVAVCQGLVSVREVTSPSIRKSAALELSFPYDWSNSAMPDALLIDKVVERGLFEDMVKVAARFGTTPLRRSIDKFSAKNRTAAPTLNRMLGNIEKALHAQA
ncbi:MAG: helix-turn-helix transcriptional regulator [Nitrosomonadales bacterium]|nr:helix-turn-helix transcriptional regulator [Nitrosomonadales bacterium]